jgi:N-acyl-D-aspartate/D-glutamate deacylase
VALIEQSLREVLQAGAIGFTTSRSDAHETSDNRPVASRLATWEEVRWLVGVMGELGVGVFELARETAMQSRDPERREDSLRRVNEPEGSFLGGQVSTL